MTNNENKQEINVTSFMNKINAYKFSFMPASITGKLTAFDGTFLTIETRSGDVIIANVSSLAAIWTIRPKSLKTSEAI